MNHEASSEGLPGPLSLTELLTDFSLTCLPDLLFLRALALETFALSSLSLPLEM